MEDFELVLYDRINAIRDTINKYGEDNFFISFSGGKDSTILHYLIDIALPNNNIDRVFVNTGIEYNAISNYVKEMQDKDSRIKIIRPIRPIKQTLEEYGYPFKSKQHAHNLATYQRKGELSTSTIKYLGLDGSKCRRYQCPKMLQYQFSDEFKIKVSEKCCDKLKKEPIARYQKESGRIANITGMRRAEMGFRNNISCVVTDKDNKVIKFNPLSVVSDEWCD